MNHNWVVRETKKDIVDWLVEGKAGFMMAEEVDEFIEGSSFGLFDLELVLLHILQLFNNTSLIS